MPPKIQQHGQDRELDNELPRSETTGVPTGVTFTPSGSITINTAGAVVSGLNVNGEVIIDAPDVTLVNCRVSGGISVFGSGAVIDHVDLTGGFGIVGGDNATVQFCDISGTENGICA